MRQAIYDGPIDLRGYTLQPVLLERLPDFTNGDAVLEPMQVVSNTLISDSAGILTNLTEGVVYLPSGCSQPGCAQIYTGGEAVSMDQLVVRFRLRPGVLWSDGAPLSAGDSVYSYHVARDLYPRVRPSLINITSSYEALDELTVEWRGVPGAIEPDYQSSFFTPFPEHAWSALTPEELLTAEITNRAPLGWGAYTIEEWTEGDHITLRKNLNYFRSNENLPRFDKVVYRFVGTGDGALAALQAGECDYLDDTSLSETPKQRLLELQEEGQLKAVGEPGMAWEHADFGLVPLDPERVSIFTVKELRQAIALCINREALSSSLFFGKPVTLNTYLPATHPLYEQAARAYAYDPQTAAGMLSAAGWEDVDGNPDTPRISQGVAGVPDGTNLAYTYKTLGGGERQLAAEMIRENLAGCGIQVNLEFDEREALFAPGPEGPVFGRRFEMAQFAWPIALQPACFLYTTSEIPGPYPQFPKGWGGANATGYSNPAFDDACRTGMRTLPDMPEYAQAQRQAQVTFAEDLPVIPLYVHLTWAAMRGDLCGIDLSLPVENSLWNLENWDYGDSESCE